MQKLVFDSGIREFQLVEGAGVLRFNPSDLNVYNRFLEASKKVVAVEGAFVAKVKNIGNDGAEALRLIAEADRELKKILRWVFGEKNDFDRILNGVNLMAVGENEERVITNLFHVLLPVFQEGVERCAQQKIDAAVTQAKQNRQQRRAKK